MSWQRKTSNLVRPRLVRRRGCFGAEEHGRDPWFPQRGGQHDAQLRPSAGFSTLQAPHWDSASNTGIRSSRYSTKRHRLSFCDGHLLYGAGHIPVHRRATMALWTVTTLSPPRRRGDSEKDDHESEFRLQGLSTKCWKRGWKEFTTCSGKVVPKLRFASCAKTRVVEKRLPNGDCFRRVRKSKQSFFCERNAPVGDACAK